MEHVMTDFFPLLALARSADLLGTTMSLPVDRPAPRSSSRPRVSWLERIDHWFEAQRSRSREAWLAQSQDVFELERRIRELERASGSRYY
jgi:hypothetical protein